MSPESDRYPQGMSDREKKELDEKHRNENTEFINSAKIQLSQLAAAGEHAAHIPHGGEGFAIAEGQGLQIAAAREHVAHVRHVAHVEVAEVQGDKGRTALEQALRAG